MSLLEMIVFEEDLKVLARDADVHTRENATSVPIKWKFHGDHPNRAGELF